MKVGDIVQWIPAYLKYAEMPEMPKWIGIILSIKKIPAGMQAKVYWFSNKENYHTADLTPINHLKKISNS